MITIDKTEEITDFNILETIRNEIQAEHTLISHRMTWYVTSQSFLMTAYAVSFGKDHSWRIFFQYAIPILGVALSLLALSAIDAAVKAQNDVIKLQNDVLVGMIRELLERTGKRCKTSDSRILFVFDEADPPALRRLKDYAKTEVRTHCVKSSLD